MLSFSASFWHTSFRFDTTYPIMSCLKCTNRNKSYKFTLHIFTKLRVATKQSRLILKCCWWVHIFWLIISILAFFHAHNITHFLLICPLSILSFFTSSRLTSTQGLPPPPTPMSLSSIGHLILIIAQPRNTALNSALLSVLLPMT